jgi:hypothetical protein
LCWSHIRRTSAETAQLPYAFDVNVSEAVNEQSFADARANGEVALTAAIQFPSLVTQAATT